MAVAGSITALFLRGFKLNNFTDNFKNKSFETPSFDVWLLKTTNYSEKMDAYKDGLAAANQGLGVYVIPEESQWTWVAGVYTDEAIAVETLNQCHLSTDTKVALYQIKGKKFQIRTEAVGSCQRILVAVQNVFYLLLDLRNQINDNYATNNIQLELTRLLNQIKGCVDELQKINLTLQSQLIATIIYTANQNILGLQDVINLEMNGKNNLAIVNTALLKIIFSLDNF